MAVQTKPVAKKIAAKPVKPVAKKAPAKATAKPVAKAPTKAELAATEKAKAAKVAATAARKAEAAKAREARENERAEQTAEVVRMKAEGQKWPEIATALGISQGKAQLLNALSEGAEAGYKKATPALVVKERDGGKSWLEIMSLCGISKSAAQNLYREGSGKDPSETYIGKGGRYFSHEAAIAPLREATKKAPAPKKASAPKAVASGKPLFNDETPKEEIISAVEGKMIATKSGNFRVRAGSAKVGKEPKSGTRVLRFVDGKTGGVRTVSLSTITKITK
jgi:hypothetical protein